MVNEKSGGRLAWTKSPTGTPIMTASCEQGGGRHGCRCTPDFTFSFSLKNRWSDCHSQWV